MYMIWRLSHPQPKVAEPQIRLYLHEKKICIEMKLEEYITGTVAAEMPASFGEEALKAQAVAARSYTLNKLLGGASFPLGADLSDDFNTCQAYIDRETFARLHPYQSTELWNKVAGAVRATRGEIMLYNNKPINAVYYSTCGGRTASAREAWGKEVPYLQSVECTFCRESKNYDTRQTFKYGEISSDLAKSIGQQPAVKILERAPSGRVKKISLNRQVYSGEEFRKMLKLPSTWISVEAHSEELIINSHGYGHGVGMCQYGANGMASAGYDYRQILHKYYQKIELYKINY